MSLARDRDVHCPRCRYNLRGLTTPRCPECGFAFRFAELETGLLRENIPTWLDRADPWQPHQLLVRSLYELARGALRPRRLLSGLDVNGPLAPAWLMLVLGTFWLWVLSSGLVAVAIVLHTGASPAAAAKAGALIWGPRLVLSGLLVSFGVTALVTAPEELGVASPTLRQQFRLAGYQMPCCASYGCLPMAIALCVAPEYVLDTRVVEALYPILWVLFGLLIVALPPEYRRRGQALLKRLPRVGTASFSFALAAATALWLWPGSLEPPWWVYF